ncbi:ComEC/Rec2 family competence protein [Cutibacterium equinum]|uniref:ComEC/Rec2 family competence protein n=1 Tax=Cutibacterium equinum TaxID=3016342 RepID=A0ABY7R2S3_9ACTN|nr:ComEC/Rec2 family competence protein [Cutibacterium equinum]WCC81048.1 ComEC/Rec2 family competence protein [Cutibacterium equinum]
MVPVAAVACVAAALGTSDHPRLILAAAAGCLVATMIAAWRTKWLVVVAALVGLSVLATSGMRNHIVHDMGVAELADAGAMATLTGRVTVEPRTFEGDGPGGSTVMITLAVSRVATEDRVVKQATQVVVMATGARSAPASKLAVGDHVEVRGLLTPPRPGRAESAVVKLRSPPKVVARPGPLDRAVNHFRAGLVTAVAGCPDGQRAIVPSLVLGDTTAVSDDMSDDFRVTALTHLMAVSGANLASTTALVWWIGAWCGMKRRGLRVLSVIGVVGFVVVCRAEASVVRAAAMGAVAMAATGVSFDRRGGVRTLAVAVTGLMLVDPWLVRSVGFWLSACATAGILWWAQPWASAMAWAPTWLAAAVTVPWAAQLATQPVVTWMAGSVSTTGLVANLAAAPFVPPASALGMTAALVALIWPPLAVPLGRLAGWCVQPIIWIAHLGAKAPAGLLTWPVTGTAIAVLGGLCLGLALMTPTVLARPWLTTLAGLVILAATVVRPPVAGWPGTWQVAVCDVGPGSAALVRAGPRAAVVVDTGPDPGRLGRCLDDLDVDQVPMVVLSHDHPDSVGGFDVISDHGPTTTVVVPALSSAQGVATPVGQTAARLGAQVIAAHSGQVMTVGTARLELFASHPLVDAEAPQGEPVGENTSRLIVKVTVEGLRVLLAGDAEPDAQRHLLTGHADLSSDVLVIARRESSHEDGDFWAATGASVAVMSAGTSNSSGRSSHQAASLAATMGMQVHSTGEEGTVLLARRGETVLVQTRS